jgi:predicted nucleic acid-binding protein
VNTNISTEAVLLDTNVYSYLGKKGDTRAELYKPHVIRKLVAVSFVTVGEVHFGARKNGWGAQKIRGMEQRFRSVVIVPYDVEICIKYAEIKAALPKGRTVSDNDLWIAACAIRHGIPLITHNRKHFDHIPGLVLISEQKVEQELKSQATLSGLTSNGPEPPSSQSPDAEEA